MKVEKEQKCEECGKITDEGIWNYQSYSFVFLCDECQRKRGLKK